MSLSRIDHVQLAMPTGGEDRARAFYAGALGLTEMPKPSHLARHGGVWFRSGDLVVHLGVDPDFRAATKAHPAFRCVDYEALLERLAAHGVAVTPDEYPFGESPHCYVTDPFGNRIELISD